MLRVDNLQQFVSTGAVRWSCIIQNESHNFFYSCLPTLDSSNHSTPFKFYLTNNMYLHDGQHSKQQQNYWHYKIMCVNACVSPEG